MTTLISYRETADRSATTPRTVPLPIHPIAELCDWVAVAHLMIIDNELSAADTQRLLDVVFADPAATALFHKYSGEELMLRRYFQQTTRSVA